MKNYILLFLFAFGSCLPAFSQKVIELESLPTDIKWETPERQYFSQMLNNEVVTNVAKPTLTTYLPDPSAANGTALIIAPGGGFHLLSILSEGNDLAKWCVEQGIAAFVLKYRLVPTGEDGVMELMQKFQEPEQFNMDVEPIVALSKADGLAAIEYVRKHAQSFHVNPDQIGIIGFSAGGTLAAGAAFEYTSSENRPNFTAPIYPAMDLVDTEKMPEDPMPMYIAVTADDIFGFQTQSADLFKQWNAAGQPVELHIYQKGGHGFGMRIQNLPSDKWIETIGAWLDSNGWLNK